MPSLRPSQYNRQPRPDGGPFLCIVEHPEYEQVDAYFSEVPEDQVTDESQGALLLTINADRLTMYPINVRSDRADYLQPKYESLRSIEITPWTHTLGFELPTNQEDVEELLLDLPDGFSKDFRFGLGLLWEYRSIMTTIASIPSIQHVVLHGGETRISDEFYLLGLDEYAALRTDIKRIAARHSRRGTDEKRDTVYHRLLHAIDPQRFPKITRRYRQGELSEIVRADRAENVLSPDDQRAALQLVEQNLPTLAAKNARRVATLKADLELLTLKQMIDEFDRMIEKRLPEPRWQRFFEDNPFILSLAFATPYVSVQGQPYAGGTRINGSGAKYGDFLMTAAATGNLALVEIKKTDTKLLNAASRDDIFPLSRDAMAAIAQVLDQRRLLLANIAQLKEASDRHDIHAFSVRCVVIAGMTPSELHQRKSFELQRNALNDVTLITYDELIARLKQIAEALTPAPVEFDPPF